MWELLHTEASYIKKLRVITNVSAVGLREPQALHRPLGKAAERRLAAVGLSPPRYGLRDTQAACIDSFIQQQFHPPSNAHSWPRMPWVGSVQGLGSRKQIA